MSFVWVCPKHGVITTVDSSIEFYAINAHRTVRNCLREFIQVRVTP
jgi:hypothetical protein